jgi:hypothetical protein
MFPENPIAEFTAQMQTLQQEAEALSDELRGPAAELARGIPIDDGLLTRVREVSARIVELRRRLKEFGTTNQLLLKDADLEGARFADLSDLLRTFEVRSEKRLEGVHRRLARIEELELVRPEWQGHFQVVFDEAGRLRELAREQRGPALPQALLELESESHRLNRLVRFLEIQQNPADVNPDEMDVVEADVERAFDKRFRVLISLRGLRLKKGTAPGAEIGAVTSPKAEAQAPATTVVEAIPTQAAGEEAVSAPMEREEETPAGSESNASQEAGAGAEAEERREDAPAAAESAAAQTEGLAAAQDEEPAPVAATEARAVAAAEKPLDPKPEFPQPGPAMPSDNDELAEYAEALAEEAEREARVESPQLPAQPQRLPVGGGPKELRTLFLGEESEALAQEARSLLPRVRTKALPEDTKECERLASQLFSCGRFGLACVLWRGFRPGGEAFTDGLPGCAMRSSAIASLLYRPDGESAEVLSEDCDLLFQKWQEPIRPDYYYWFLAIAVKPALFEGDQGARDLLWRIAKQGDKAPAGVTSLAKAVAEFATAQMPLDPMQIRSEKYIGTRDLALSALKDKALRLMRRYSGDERASGSAKEVWRYLMDEDGAVRCMLLPVAEGKGSLEEALATARAMSKRSKVHRVIEDGEAARTHGAGSIRRGSPDFEKLVGDIEDAAEIVTGWARLSAEGPSGGQMPVETLRQDFENARKVLEGELSEHMNRTQDPPVMKAACRACHEVLEGIGRILSGEVEGWPQPAGGLRLIESDLSAIPGQNVNAWQNQCDREDGLRVLEFVGNAGTWRECAERLVDANEYGGLARLAQQIRQLSEEAADELEAYRAACLARQWGVLLTRFRRSEQLLDLSAQNSLIAMNVAASFRAQLDGIQKCFPKELLERQEQAAGPLPAPAESRFFAEALRTIDTIDEEVGQSRRHFHHEASHAVALPERATPRVRAAMRRLVAAGAFKRALSLAEAVKFSAPPSKAAWTALNDFFPRVPDTLVRSDMTAADMVAEMERLGFGYSDPETRTEGENALRRWTTLRAWIDQYSNAPPMERSDSWKPEHLRAVLEFVGFQVPPGFIKAPDFQLKNRPQLNVPIIPTEDRRLCPAWEFGSQSRGMLRVVLLRKKTEAEDLPALLGNLAHPTLVLYFRPYSAEQRRALARACWNGPKTFLLLDEALMAYLATRVSGRFRAFFECTLPFTYSQPYVSTGGSLPPEMFFGRETQKAGLQNYGLPHLVYGGRQLGKTALLREVERAVELEKPSHRAIWLDLQYHGLGKNKPIEEFWGLLRSELAKREIIGPLEQTTEDGISAAAVTQAILSWLDADGTRRLLLLLDEADAMMEQDHRSRLGANGLTSQHPITSVLAGLQNDTKNRFKVIFAGLRDVQHMAYEDNHPIGKLGQPLLIGPFSPTGQEWSEQKKELDAARDLLLDPLLCRGFRFPEGRMVQEVLWATNFYPSLLQIVGENLVKTARELLLEGPPYQITEELARNVLRSPAVIKDFRHRLKLTLGLDGRFSAIVYAMAALTYDSPHLRSFDGFETSTIENKVREKNATLFTTGADVTRCLRDLVEMGVLRQTDHRYDLRSPALLELLGDYESVIKELHQERELLPPYDATKFRSPMRGSSQTGEPEFNPFTDEQVQRLLLEGNRISVCFGNRASGIDRVAAALQPHFPDKLFVTFDQEDYEEWQRALVTARERVGEKERGRTSVFFVQAACPWSLRWIEHAREKLRQYTANPVHFVFLADPKTASALNVDKPGLATPDILRLKEVGSVFLGPWADVVLRTWLHELGYDDASQKDRKKLTEALGNWPAVLTRFHAFAKSTDKDWREDLEDFRRTCLSSHDKVADYLDLLGIKALSPAQRSSLSYLRLGFSIEDLREDDNSIPHERVLDWAEHMGLLTKSAGQLEWNPFVSALLDTPDFGGL